MAVYELRRRDELPKTFWPKRRFLGLPIGPRSPHGIFAARPFTVTRDEVPIGFYENADLAAAVLEGLREVGAEGDVFVYPDSTTFVKGTPDATR